MKATWLLIANASQARLFKIEKNLDQIELIEEFYHPESREKIANLISDGAGRYRAYSNNPKSAFEVPFNPKQVEAQRFANLLASKLNEGRTKNLYNNLILIAPSHFQGMLNKSCTIHVKNRIINTLHKDYTKVKTHNLRKYLNGLITKQAA